VPDDDPLTQTIVSGDTFEGRIVGVVHDVIERSVDRPPGPAMYLPMAQSDIRTRSIVMRTAGDPADVIPATRAAIWSIDADIPVYQVQTMESVVNEGVGGFAVIGYLMGVFALLSLVLGAVGIYGVTAYSAGQRTSEIGVRLALGAERTSVVRMVVRQGARRTILGLVIGLGLAAAMGGAMSGILIGVRLRDPFTFGTVTVVLSFVSFLASISRHDECPGSIQSRRCRRSSCVGGSDLLYRGAGDLRRRASGT
jgi:putative ABC transport system permease protein